MPAEAPATAEEKAGSTIILVFPLVFLIKAGLPDG